MGWAAIAAAVAASGMMTSTPAQTTERANNFHKDVRIETEKPVVQILRVVAGSVAALAVYETADKPIEIYPLQFESNGSGFSLAEKLSFKRGGFDLSLSAFSPKLTTESGPMREIRNDARKMAKAMPGYPQPAQLVVGLKVAF